MHLAAPLLAVLLQAQPEGVLVARLQLDLPPSPAAAAAPAPAPDLATPAPPPTRPAPPPMVQVDRGAPPGAVLAGAGMVLASDLAFTLLALRGFADAWNSDGRSGGELFLLGGLGLAFVTPLAAVKGAGWTGLEGNEVRAYWTTFGVRLGALVVLGMINQANRTGAAADVLSIAYAVTEFWLQPWVAARVLGQTSLGPAPAPLAASPASAARPVADPALAR